MARLLTAGLSAADTVARQLIEVGDRLCREFAVADGPTPESVREQVRRARADFGSPRVLTYLPVLVERTVRHDLGRARGHDGPGRG